MFGSPRGAADSVHRHGFGCVVMSMPGKCMQTAISEQAFRGVIMKCGCTPPSNIVFFGKWWQQHTTSRALGCNLRSKLCWLHPTLVVFMFHVFLEGISLEMPETCSLVLKPRSDLSSVIRRRLPLGVLPFLKSLFRRNSLVVRVLSLTVVLSVFACCVSFVAATIFFSFFLFGCVHP